MGLFTLERSQDISSFSLQLSVEMMDDLHLLAQSFPLLASLEHFSLSFLPSIPQSDILKLLEGETGDQAGDIIEAHAYSPVAQDVKDTKFGVLLKVTHPHPIFPFVSLFFYIGAYFLAGEHGSSGDSTGNRPSRAFTFP